MPAVGTSFKGMRRAGIASAAQLTHRIPAHAKRWKRPGPRKWQRDHVDALIAPQKALMGGMEDLRGRGPEPLVVIGDDELHASQDPVRQGAQEGFPERLRV